MPDSCSAALHADAVRRAHRRRPRPRARVTASPSRRSTASTRRAASPGCVSTASPSTDDDVIPDGAATADRPRSFARRGRGRRRRRRRRCRWRSTTPRCASSSGARSAPSRPSSTTSPTCSSTPSWPRPWRGTPPVPAAAATQGALAGAVAATQALPAYRRCAEKNIQLLGGIGFTWEHDAHLHLRRAWALATLFDHDAASRRHGTRRERRDVGRAAIDLPARGRGVPSRGARVQGAVRRPPRRRAAAGTDRVRVLHAALAGTVGPRRRCRRAARDRRGAARRRAPAARHRHVGPADA